jgi:hypothetical protein
MAKQQDSAAKLTGCFFNAARLHCNLALFPGIDRQQLIGFFIISASQNDPIHVLILFHLTFLLPVPADSLTNSSQSDRSFEINPGKPVIYPYGFILS